MEALGRRMNIVGGPSEALFPKNVGLLFFNDHPHEFFPATQIDVVWFPDGPGGDYFEEKEFRGPLAAILRDAVSYIERNLPEGGSGQAPPQARSRSVLELSDSGDRRGARQRHLPPILRGARTGGGEDHAGGVAGAELSRRGPVHPNGGSATGPGCEPPLPQPADRRVPEGTGLGGRPLDGRAEDPAGDAQQRLTGAELRDRR